MLKSRGRQQMSAGEDRGERHQRYGDGQDHARSPAVRLDQRPGQGGAGADPAHHREQQPGERFGAGPGRHGQLGDAAAQGDHRRREGARQDGEEDEHNRARRQEQRRDHQRLQDGKPQAGLAQVAEARADDAEEICPDDLTLQDELRKRIVKRRKLQAFLGGPSTMFTIERLPNRAELLDLTTFLDFANAHNMRLDAIAWHETGPDHLQPFDRLPDSIANHVDRIRNELFRWPNIGKPQLIVNEYGTGRAIGVPGWRVAYLAGLENAGVDGQSGHASLGGRNVRVCRCAATATHSSTSGS